MREKIKNSRKSFNTNHTFIRSVKSLTDVKLIVCQCNSSKTLLNLNHLRIGNVWPFLGLKQKLAAPAFLLETSQGFLHAPFPECRKPFVVARCEFVPICAQSGAIVVTSLLEPAPSIIHEGRGEVRGGRRRGVAVAKGGRFATPGRYTLWIYLLFFSYKRGLNKNL